MVEAGAAAQEPEPVKLAVMTLEDATGEGLAASLLDNLSDYLRTQIARRGTFIVIDKSRQADALKKLVGDAKKESYNECYDDSCQIPLGKALSADTILRVKLSRIGSNYQMNAEMVDLAREAVDPGKAASVEIDAEPRANLEDRLLEAMREVARQIAGDMPGGAGETINLGTAGSYGLVTEGGKFGGKDGIVRFESVPAGAKVEVDGKVLARGTPVEEFLTLGTRRVRMFGQEGHEPFDESVELKSGQTVRVSLRPITGDVVIRARDDEGNLLTDVAVLLDGEEVARAPVRLQGVLSGYRRFRFEAERVRPVDMTVSIRPSETSELEVKMPRLMGKLVVEHATIGSGSTRAVGQQATVFVDGAKMGMTPLEVRLAAGDHEVSVGHPLGNMLKRAVSIEDGATLVLKPELDGASGTPWEEHVRRLAVERRTGSFWWANILSSAPGRFHLSPARYWFDGDDGDDEHWHGNMFEIRALQVLTVGYNAEGSFVSWRIQDALIDVSLFDFDKEGEALTGEDVTAISPLTNPSTSLAFRPGALFPLRFETGGEFYWAFSSDDATEKVDFKSATARAHLVAELWQDYYFGFARLEAAGGLLWRKAWGKVSPADHDPMLFSSEGWLYGGEVSWLLPFGEEEDEGVVALGAGFYRGQTEGEYRAVWTLDWRGGTKD